MKKCRATQNMESGELRGQHYAKKKGWKIEENNSGELHNTI